jgi:hypothetical protein
MVITDEQIETPPLLPGFVFTTSLETWIRTAMDQHIDAEQYLLEEVVHYKALTAMQHEFLVVCASHPTRSSIYLGIDRNGGSLAALKQVFSEVGSGLSSSSSSSRTGMCQGSAYDTVQISYDGTPNPILALYEATAKLSTISFAPLENAAGKEEGPRPSLLHLSILLLTIRENSPRYPLLQYNCYFFARATCLALKKRFGSTETRHTDEWQEDTWCRMHVSRWSATPNVVKSSVLLSGAAKGLGLFPGTATRVALLKGTVTKFAVLSSAPGSLGLVSGAAKCLALLSPLAYPALLVCAVLFTAYNVVELYRAIRVQIAANRREIRYAYPIQYAERHRDKAG